jgi:O-antigen ligase
LDEFKASPVMGTGFGHAARYQRNDERPWIYELTYYQMLMNAGVLGVALIGGLLLTYGLFILNIFRRFKRGSVIPFGLLTGVISLLMGASSNPYLGSFDLLFFVGFLPFIATFRRGFEVDAVGK